MTEMTHLDYQQPSSQQMIDAEGIVKRFAELWDRPVAERFRALMHEDTRNLIPPMTEPANRDGVVEHFSRILKQFPDMRLDVVRWAPTGDVVLIEWAASATVAGALLRWNGIDRIAVRDGRMYQADVYWDTRRLAEKVARAIQTATPPAPAASELPSFRKALAEIYFNLWRLV